ncbi:MAG: extracellular solute-binding protein [Eubacteriales bacterium]|nr:extracellular solute-binding protein [Eubacteriales bacterium]
MKKFFFLSLLILSLLTLTGCHGSKGPDAFVIPEEFDTSRNFELTFWAKNDTNKNQTNVYERAIRDFEALYPNITVNMRLYTDYSRIYNDVITNISTGTTPNICITYPDHIATYMTGVNVVVPLDELLTDEHYGMGAEEIRFDAPTAGEIVPKFLEECIIDGQHYALPYMRSTEACYINKDMVEALGYEVPDVLTWDFVWEVSEAAMAKDKDGTFLINHQKVMIPFIYKSTDNMMIQMLRQSGGAYSDESGRSLLFNADTRAILEEIAVHAGTGAFSTFKISSYPANFLNAGQCIFAVDSTAGSTWMGAHAPLSDISPDKFVEFETVVRTVPQFDPDAPQMISQGPSLCIFNREDPQEVLASWFFMQYMLSDKVQTAYSETEGYVPVTLTAQKCGEYRDYLSRAGEDDAHYAIKIDSVKLLLDNMDNTFITPVYNGSASLRDAAGQLIESTVKSVRRHETTDSAYFDRLFYNTAGLYRLDSAGHDTVGAQQSEPGELPTASKVLLASLCTVWALLLAVYLYRISRKQKTVHNHT